MAAEQLDSKYDRFFSVTADEFGIDPLKDKVLPEILKITTYTQHVVTQEERGAPDLIAYRKYRSEKLWWIILAYNGIASYRDIVEGLKLKIPSQASVTSVITDKAVSTSRVQRVITI